MIPASQRDVRCFFDDAPEKQSHRIHNIPVKGWIDEIPEKLRTMKINLIIVSIPSLDEKWRQEILQMLAGPENA